MKIKMEYGKVVIVLEDANESLSLEGFDEGGVEIRRSFELPAPRLPCINVCSTLPEVKAHPKGTI